jgi:hypothetical protein
MSNKMRRWKKRERRKISEKAVREGLRMFIFVDIACRLYI